MIARDGIETGPTTSEASPRHDAEKIGPSLRAVQLAIVVTVIAVATATVPRLARPFDYGRYEDVAAGGWSHQMTTSRVDVLFLGNSLVKWGIDVEDFERLTGRNTHALWAAYAAGGWWYLVLDRVVAEVPHPPKLVVVCFSDDALTLTTLVKDQHALDRVIQMLDEEDRRSGTADRVAESAHSPAVAFLDRNWALVRARIDARQRVEGAVTGYVGWMAGGSGENVAAAMSRVFGLERKDNEQLNRRAEPTFDPRLYDFDRMKEGSFLPDMLDSAGAKRLPLLFVRMPRRMTRTRRADPEREAALRRYVTDLTSYLEERGYPLLDFSALEGLDANRDFEAGDHLSESGRALFMPALLDAVEPYLPPARTENP